MASLGTAIAAMEQATAPMPPTSKAWLTAALDPFHDTALKLSGYPGLQSRKTVTTVYKTIFSLEAPAADGQSPTASFVNIAPATSLTSLSVPSNDVNIQIGSTLTASAGVFTLPYVAEQPPSSLKPFQLSATSPGAWGPAPVTVWWKQSDGRSAGYRIFPALPNIPFRVVAMGAEVKDVTPEMYRQGMIYCSSPPLSKSPHTVWMKEAEGYVPEPDPIPGITALNQQLMIGQSVNVEDLQPTLSIATQSLPGYRLVSNPIPTTAVAVVTRPLEQTGGLAPTLDTLKQARTAKINGSLIPYPVDKLALQERSPDPGLVPRYQAAGVEVPDQPIYYSFPSPLRLALASSVPGSSSKGFTVVFKECAGFLYLGTVETSTEANERFRGVYPLGVPYLATGNPLIPDVVNPTNDTAFIQGMGAADYVPTYVLNPQTLDGSQPSWSDGTTGDLPAPGQGGSVKWDPRAQISIVGQLGGPATSGTTMAAQRGAIMIAPDLALLCCGLVTGSPLVPVDVYGAEGELDPYPPIPALQRRLGAAPTYSNAASNGPTVRSGGQLVTPIGPRLRDGEVQGALGLPCPATWVASSRAVERSLTMADTTEWPLWKGAYIVPRMIGEPEWDSSRDLDTLNSITRESLVEGPMTSKEMIVGLSPDGEYWSLVSGSTSSWAETTVNVVGANFAGDGPTTKLVVTLIYYCEMMPPATERVLVSMATPAAIYDPDVLRVYATARAGMPLATPVANNAIGGWLMLVAGLVGSALKATSAISNAYARRQELKALAYRK